MPYAFIQDVPIDTAFYERIRQGLGTEPPTGMISHVAIERPDGGLRYVDVWDSEEDFERFADERLHPVVHSLLAEIFGDEVPPEPDRATAAVVDVWLGR